MEKSICLTNPFLILFKKIRSLFANEVRHDKLLALSISKFTNENFIQQLERQGRMVDYLYHIELNCSKKNIDFTGKIA